MTLPAGKVARVQPEYFGAIITASRGSSLLQLKKIKLQSSYS